MVGAEPSGVRMVFSAAADAGVGGGEPEGNLAELLDGGGGDDSDDLLELDAEEFNGLGGGLGFVLQEADVDVEGPAFDDVGLVGDHGVGGPQEEREEQEGEEEAVKFHSPTMEWRPRASWLRTARSREFAHTIRIVEADARSADVGRRWVAGDAF